MKVKVALKNPAFHPWLIALPAVILRLWHLGSCSPLWYDEAYTAMVIRLPLGRMFTAILGDVHPPLYYLLLWAWKFLVGSSAAALRLPSAFISCLSLLVFWQITGSFDLSRRARLLALALMAYVPVNIYYAQEARMYALLQLLILCQLWAIHRRAWVALAVFTAAALYTHNYSLFYTAALALYAFLQELKRPRLVYRPGIDGELTGTEIKNLFGSLAWPAALWSPWILALCSQMRTIQGHYWIEPLSVGSLLHALYKILVGSIPAQFIPISAFCFFSALLLLTLSALQKPRRLGLLILTYGPPALALIASLLWQPVILWRGFIGLAAPLCLLAGDFLARARRRSLVIGLACLIPWGIGFIWYIGASSQGLAKNMPAIPVYPPGLPVVHLDDATYISKQDTTAYLLDACPDEAGSLSPQTRAGMGIKRVTLADLPQEYIFAAQLFPLSTSCHERIYHQLSQGAEQIFLLETPLSAVGVWHVSTKR